MNLYLRGRYHQYTYVYLALQPGMKTATQRQAPIHSFHFGRHNREKRGGTHVVATHVRLNWIYKFPRRRRTASNFFDCLHFLWRFITPRHFIAAFHLCSVEEEGEDGPSLFFPALGFLKCDVARVTPVVEKLMRKLNIDESGDFERRWHHLGKFTGQSNVV